MRMALFSDIHGNITGLKAILAKIDDLGGADMLIAAGDLIGESAGTEDLLDLLLERHVHLIRGNHEELMQDEDRYFAIMAEPWQDYARRNAEWLHAHLSLPYWELLASLPLSKTIDVESGRYVFICHASPESTSAKVCAPTVPIDTLRTIYGAVDADVVVYGHWHQHHALWLDNQLLLNVASVGLRKDGVCAFTILEYTDRWIVQQYLTPYDVQEEQRLMIARKVPQL